jgi:hypothetical protein
MMVGEQWDDNPRVDAGAVVVFERTGDYWVRRHKITASDPGYWDNFGGSVRLQGETAVISSPADDIDGHGNDAGSIYLFTRSEGAWIEREKITATDGATNDHFGWGLPASGNTLFVGAPDDDHSGTTDAGSVYVYLLPYFADGFESGDTSAWSSTVP